MAEIKTKKYWEHRVRSGKKFRNGDLVEAVGSVWKIIGGVQYTYINFNETENVYKMRRVRILKPNPYSSRPQSIGDIALFSSWILN